jgi:hypothetical protein
MTDTSRYSYPLNSYHPYSTAPRLHKTSKSTQVNQPVDDSERRNPSVKSSKDEYATPSQSK